MNWRTYDFKALSEEGAACVAAPSSFIWQTVRVQVIFEKPGALVGGTLPTIQENVRLFEFVYKE